MLLLLLLLLLLLTVPCSAIEKESAYCRLTSEEESSSLAHHFRAVRPLKVVVDEGQGVLGGVEQPDQHPVLERVGRLLAVKGELRRDEVRQDVVREDVAAPVAEALICSTQSPQGTKTEKKTPNERQRQHTDKRGLCVNTENTREGRGGCDKRRTTNKFATEKKNERPTTKSMNDKTRRIQPNRPRTHVQQKRTDPVRGNHQRNCVRSTEGIEATKAHIPTPTSTPPPSPTITNNRTAEIDEKHAKRTVSERVEISTSYSMPSMPTHNPASSGHE